MKKLVFVLAVVASASLFSCGNSNKEAEAVDTAAVEVEAVEAITVDTLANDSAVVDSTVAVVEEVAQ